MNDAAPLMVGPVRTVSPTRPRVGPITNGVGMGMGVQSLVPWDWISPSPSFFLRSKTGLGTKMLGSKKIAGLGTTYVGHCRCAGDGCTRTNDQCRPDGSLSRLTCI